MPRLLRRGALGALLVLATACGGDGDGAADEVARQTEVYAAVVLDVADDLPVEPGGDPSDRIVFVEPLDSVQPHPIEVQAGVVLALEDEVDVAFIDERDEAVDRSAPGRPVRDGAALIAVGPVPEGDDRVEVEVRRYHRQGREERLRMVVASEADGWEVVDRVVVAPA
jgi:hypothetical protein